MKKTITFVAALLLCVGAFAESYTLNFVECSKTDGDGGYVRNSSNQIEYMETGNTTVRVKDCYNNEYTIYSNKKCNYKKQK